MAPSPALLDAAHPSTLARGLLIALDADGVLLDYNRAFGKIWERCHCRTLACAEPRAYHATHYWGLERPAPEDPFWARFDAEGWHAMDAMPGAVAACHQLVDAGHRLVCVSSMPIHRQAARLANLQALGFPIDTVVATGHCQDPHRNPKREAIARLAPDWFVDDELRKLRDLPGVACVLVDPGHPDSPNAGQADGFLTWRVKDLAEFAERLVPAPRPRAAAGLAG